jgi:cytochrome c
MLSFAAEAQRMRSNTRRLSLGAIAAIVLQCQPVPSAQDRALSSQWDGIFTDAQASRGRTLYATHCLRCHGEDLQGVPKPISFRGDSDRTPALTGYQFNRNWNQMPVADILERIRISMPAGNPAILSRQQVADIFAFMLAFASYPAGSNDIPPDYSRLKGVIFSPFPQ